MGQAQATAGRFAGGLDSRESALSVTCALDSGHREGRTDAAAGRPMREVDTETPWGVGYRLGYREGSAGGKGADHAP